MRKLGGCLRSVRLPLSIFLSQFDITRVCSSSFEFNTVIQLQHRGVSLQCSLDQEAIVSSFFFHLPNQMIIDLFSSVKSNQMLMLVLENVIRDSVTYTEHAKRKTGMSVLLDLTLRISLSYPISSFQSATTHLLVDTRQPNIIRTLPHSIPTSFAHDSWDQC
jgi:hypothetical protein